MELIVIESSSKGWVRLEDQYSSPQFLSISCYSTPPSHLQRGEAQEPMDSTWKNEGDFDTPFSKSRWLDGLAVVQTSALQRRSKQ